MSDTTIAGPRLPPWEVDTLGWMAGVFNEAGLYSPGISAEIVTGEDAILLRFPSGGERYVYLDDRPHGEPPVSHAALREIKAERNTARMLATRAQADLADCRAVIASARALLERINADDRLTDLPEWIKDSVGSAYETLAATPLRG